MRSDPISASSPAGRTIEVLLVPAAAFDTV
jgi:hypothetical protein